jgi:hypothetical protein
MVREDVGADPGLENLLELDGVTYEIHEQGYWVKFEVKRTAVSKQRPHGISYSFTMHAASGKRLIGFDNAHAARSSAGPGGRRKAVFDHWHRLNYVRPYEYRDAETLIADFWTAVDELLRKRGINV